MIETFFATALAVIIAGAVAKMGQLTFFSKHMNREIDRIFSTDEWMQTQIDIHASYSKLERSMPWNFNFASMMVYDKR